MTAIRTRGVLPDPPEASRAVFLNMAYGPESERLLLAYVCGLAELGLVPVLALELTDSGRRLDHIRALLRGCVFSLHDLYHVGAGRWNVILELGMAIEGSAGHSWFVLDAEPRRAIRALSDLNGTDIFGHAGTPKGVLGALLNIFSRPKENFTVQSLEKKYRALARTASKICKSQGAKSVFERRVFTKLLAEAAILAQSGPPPGR